MVKPNNSQQQIDGVAYPVLGGPGNLSLGQESITLGTGYIPSTAKCENPHLTMD